MSDGADPFRASRRSVPPTIAGYRELVEVGRGGYAVVYRAEQVALRRTVALKVVLGSDVDATRVRRFERECAAIGALSGHPHVVSVFDAGTTELGMPFLSMEYLPRGSLGDRLRAGGTVDVDEVVAIGVQLCGALEAAHQRDVLHRDIKPENVLVGEQGRCKLADFGIAVVADATQHTATGTMVGTVKHSAPEVLGGDRATVASDVYSLGSTLFTLLTGSAPFWRDGDESAMPNMLRAIRDPLPDLRQRAVPDALATVIEVACEKDPGRRFRSAAAFGVALQQVQRHLSDRVTPMDTRQLPIAASALTAAAVPPTQVAPPPTPLPGAPDPAEPVTGPPVTAKPATGPPVTALPVTPAPAPVLPVGSQPAADRRQPVALIALAAVLVAVAVAVAAWRGVNDRVDTDDSGPTTASSSTPTSTEPDRPSTTASTASTTTTTSAPASTTTTTTPPTTTSTTATPTTATPTTATPTTATPTTPPTTTPTTTPEPTDAEIARASSVAEATFAGFTISDTSPWRGGDGVSVLVGEDGSGREKVFVFIDGDLAGSDYNEPSYSLTVSEPDADSFVITYDLYRAGEDDACCAPTGALRTTFTRDGFRMRPDQRSATTNRNADDHR